ncbi:MAG: ComF family protein [Clostridia bacterium]|nr:ComF family protein [Clostridia bacterium]
MLDMILSFIFPNKCPVCDCIMSYNSLICKSCMRKIQNLNLKKELFKINNKPVYCVSPFKYEGLIRKSILKFKFKGKMSHAAFFAYMMSQTINKYYSNLDFVTFVPISSERKIKRKFDQSEILSEKISKIINVPLKSTIEKTADNAEQHNLERNEREKNILNVYNVIGKNDIKGKNILLIDDVCTTGNTLKECAKTLMTAGAKTVYCAAITMEDS